MTFQTKVTVTVLCAGFAMASPASGQVTHDDYQRALTLRNQYTSLTVDVPDPATWVDQTNRFYYRKTVRGGHEFVMVDAETRQRRPAFDHTRLAAALSTATGGPHTALRLPFETFRFSRDEQSIEMTFEGQSWTCTVSDYGCKLQSPSRTGQPRSFGVVRDLSVPADNRPKRSRDGQWEAFVQNFNVVVRRTGSNAVTVLSTDGSEGNFYDPESIQWSPDSRKLIAYRVRPGYRRMIPYIESSPEDQLVAKHSSRLYVKPGDEVDLDQPVLFHVEPARQVAVDNRLFPNPYQLSNMAWRLDSRAVTFEYNQRGHQIYRVLEIDATTGQVRSLLSEEAKTFVNYRAATPNARSAGKRYRYDVADGREIIWMSERDGWSHLYLHDGVTGAVKNQITNGNWVVRSVERVDEQARQIWFAAGGMNPEQDPYFRQYYRINFDGTGLTRLTDADADHDVAISPDLKYYVATYSRVDMAPVSELRRSADATLVTVLERGDISALRKAGWRAPEVFTAKGRDGQTDIWGIIVRPSNFNGSKKYPVIENIYAGPQGSFVPKTFAAFLAHQAQAELGFIVVQIDGMGTANRSKAFHDVAWKNLGDAGFPDRIRWHQAVAAKYPSYDITRVGIYGGSAGGQNSLGGLLFHPQFYKVAVSYVGCHDNRMDKISWNEQWMGWPVDEHYAASSNVDNAWRLQGKVLLILGELDTNVDPASTMQVVNALIKANKVFDLLVIPGGEHNAGRSDEHAEYGERKRFDFFVQHLLGQQPPNWNEAARTTTSASR
jgi:dipeptidyl aminopeptidase/acylaminoacyl peptidase